MLPPKSDPMSKGDPPAATMAAAPPLEAASTSGAATLDEVRGHGHVLTPGRYVGAADVEDDGVSFEERFGVLRAKLAGQFTQAQMLSEQIDAALELVR